MYCPRCGHQTIAEELRFCSYCGLKLGVVKAAIAESEDTPGTTSTNVTTTPSTTGREPRHRDINLGVILLFAATVIASGIAGRGFGRVAGAAVLGNLYLASIFLSGPITKGIHKLLSWEDPNSVGRKGMVFGSSLMFITSVLLAINSLLIFGRMQTGTFSLGVVLAFILFLIIGPHLRRGLRYLLNDERSDTQSTETSKQTSALPASFENPMLTPAPGIPVSLFGAQRVTTAEIVTPVSVTEHTTNLLEEK